MYYDTISDIRHTAVKSLSSLAVAWLPLSQGTGPPAPF